MHSLSLSPPSLSPTTWTLQAKQTAMEELTAGQAAVLVRNEQDIDRSAEELEDLEEMLNESIADSLRSAKQKVAGREPSSKKKKRCGHSCTRSLSWSMLPGHQELPENRSAAVLLRPWPLQTLFSFPAALTDVMHALIHSSRVQSHNFLGTADAVPDMQLVHFRQWSKWDEWSPWCHLQAPVCERDFLVLFAAGRRRRRRRRSWRAAARTSSTTARLMAAAAERSAGRMAPPRRMQPRSTARRWAGVFCVRLYLQTAPEHVAAESRRSMKLRLQSVGRSLHLTLKRTPEV